MSTIATLEGISVTEVDLSGFSVSGSLSTAASSAVESGTSAIRDRATSYVTGATSAQTTQASGTSGTSTPKPGLTIVSTPASKYYLSNALSKIQLPKKKTGAGIGLLALLAAVGAGLLLTR